MLSYRANALAAAHPPKQPRRDGAPIRQRATPVAALPHDAWFADLDRSGGHLSARLLAFLEECQDLGVTWSQKKVLLIRMSVGETVLEIMGINRNGGVEVPWFIGQHKKEFHRFAYALERVIPGAKAYETTKMWRVRKDGRNIMLSELMVDLPTLWAALEDLHSALVAVAG